VLRLLSSTHPPAPPGFFSTEVLEESPTTRKRDLNLQLNFSTAKTYPKFTQSGDMLCRQWGHPADFEVTPTIVFKIKIKDIYTHACDRD
jgi:hypothetical protein